MSVFDYDDYRKYLSELYSKEKTESWFTCRKFADRVGFTNPGYMNDVISRRRRLSEMASDKLIEYFSLSRTEQKFFKLLIEYNHAKKTEIKDLLYKQLQTMRNRQKTGSNESDYYSDYRYPLVRTVLMAVQFYGDFEDLITKIRISISTVELKKIIENLISWNMVMIDSSGQYNVVESTTIPSPKLRGQIAMIHREWIRQALRAVDEVPSSERKITSQLVAVSESMSKRIDDEIERFRERIWSMMEQDYRPATMVRQVSIQNIPYLSNHPR